MRLNFGELLIASQHTLLLLLLQLLRPLNPLLRISSSAALQLLVLKAQTASLTSMAPNRLPLAVFSVLLRQPLLAVSKR